MMILNSFRICIIQPSSTINSKIKYICYEKFTFVVILLISNYYLHRRLIVLFDHEIHHLLIAKTKLHNSWKFIAN